MARLSLPTSARLSSSIRVDPTNSAVTKALNRLSRSSLLSLVLDWLDEKNLPLCPPLLRRSARRDEDNNEEDDDNDDDDDDDYEGDFYPPARSLAQLRELYASMQAVEKGGSKREVVDRITEGDWRHGLSLYQLAMADLQHLYEHQNSLKWTAFRVQRLQNPSLSSVGENDDDDDDDEDEDVARRRGKKHNKKSLVVPRFHPSTFLQNLQTEVPPDIKAHYNFDRPKDHPLLLLRVFVLDSPYSTSLAVANRNRSDRNKGGGAAGVTSFDAARTIYIAFPDASPHIYISAAAQATTTSGGGSSSNNNATGTGEYRSLRSLVIDAIPKALSRPRERYTLVPSGLSTRNLSALLHIKGAGRTNAAGGGWGVYAPATTTTNTNPNTNTTDPKSTVDVTESPLNPTLLQLPTPPLSDTDGGNIANASINDDDDNNNNNNRKRKLKEVVVLVEGDTVEAQHERAVKRAKMAAQARFGNSARVDDGKGVERLDVLIEDAFPDVLSSSSSSINGLSDDDDGEGEEDGGAGAQNSGRGRRSNADLRFSQQQQQGGTAAADDDDSAEDDDDESGGEKKWRPRIKLAFHGAHVFAGIRQLVEAGVVDAARMPGWMTGEEGVSIGTVRHGRVKGHRGAGL